MPKRAKRKLYLRDGDDAITKYYLKRILDDNGGVQHNDQVRKIKLIIICSELINYYGIL